MIPSSKTGEAKYSGKAEFMLGPLIHVADS